MCEGLIRFEQGQPLDRHTFADGSQIPFHYTAATDKQEELRIMIDLYWFVASEKAWYIKFRTSESVHELPPAFFEDSFVLHKGQTWHIDHGRHPLNEFKS